jgi:threonine synthase
MNYVSTRGQAPEVPFSDTVLEGLAPDGGLRVPRAVPDLTRALAAWDGKRFQDVALIVAEALTDLPRTDLVRLIDASYATFAHPEVVPVAEVGPHRILELFHGPTLAFKDVALQWLGNLFEHLLDQRGGVLNIIGATSGDTGSAAIHAVKGRRNLNIVMMHPRGRTSRMQELQMTTVTAPNVANLAVEGTFDDCQRIMKSLLADTALRDRLHLGAVNSVNWARVMAQTVYYLFTGVRRLREKPGARLCFVVPTGNFGNVLAGYYAARMGLPVERLVVATNENDILHRFFSTGEYTPGPAHPTVSPSMDIQVASNFERLVFHAFGGDGARTAAAMAQLAREGRLEAPDARLPLFHSARVDTAATHAVIRETWERHGYVLDPHTAVGVAASAPHRAEGLDVTCLATAHPAKFPETIAEACGVHPTHPSLEALLPLPRHAEAMPNDAAAVRAFLERRLGG